MPYGTMYKINRGKTTATGFINTDNPGSYPMQIPFEDVPLPKDTVRRGDRVEFTFAPGTRTVASIRRVPRTE